MNSNGSKAGDTMEMQEKRYIEAALFLSSRPMSLEELRRLTGIGALGYIQTLITELQNEYIERKSALEIVEENKKYVLQIKSDYVERVRQFAQDSALSHQALRTLAYIAKHNGVLKSELVKRIGVRVYEDVFELEENEFITQKAAGRSSSLHLTDKFHQYFRLEKGKPIEMPKADEKQQTLSDSVVLEPVENQEMKG